VDEAVDAQESPGLEAEVEAAREPFSAGASQAALAEERHGLPHDDLVVECGAFVWDPVIRSTRTEIMGSGQMLLGDSDLDVLTTLFDFYGFASEGPGMTELDPRSPARARIGQLEVVVGVHIRSQVPAEPHSSRVGDVGVRRAEQIGSLLPELAEPLKSDLAGAGEAELVNDGPDTAPSKRLVKYRPRYSKTNDGPLAIADLGLDRLRELCPHLDRWLEALDARLA
jgi:hypothetical protein